jgi:WXG100 family type VII secretion target
MPMLDGYYYDFLAMEDVMSKMKASGDTIDEVIRAIETAVKNLDEDHWSGPAREGYNACQAHWDKSALQMQQAYYRALEGLTACHNNYGDAENAGQALWQSLQHY